MEPHPARGELIEIIDPHEWNRLVDTLPGAFFTQLWEWGELRRTLGWEAARLAWTGEGTREAPVGAAQVLVRRVPVIGWGVAHLPRGPMGARDAGAAEPLTGALRTWGRARRIGTLVADPDVDAASPLGGALLADPWRPGADVGENRVHVLDLPAGADPWAAVRRKHREWIRKAEKAGVEVEWTDADAPDAAASAAMGRFEQVYAELVDRLALVTHGAAFTRGLFDRFRATRRLQLVTATHAGVPVAAMLHVTYGDTMVWYAGGQAEAGAPVGAGKLLLWRSIQRAQELGFGRYHMWGTATDSLAHYKEGFGAREERYIGTRALAAIAPADGLVRAVWTARRVALGIRHRRARDRRTVPAARPRPAE